MKRLREKLPDGFSIKKVLNQEILYYGKNPVGKFLCIDDEMSQLVEKYFGKRILDPFSFEIPPWLKQQVYVLKRAA